MHMTQFFKWGGVPCAPPGQKTYGGGFFFGKRFFLYTRIPPFKNGHREVLEKYTFVFQTSRAENRAKKGLFSTNLGPRNGQNGQNGPFWPLFGDFGDFLRNEPPTLNPILPWAPKVVLGVPGI